MGSGPLTSLLGRLLRLFPDSVPLEDLFTEAVARLFETRPQLCFAWLEEVGALSSGSASGTISVRSQRSFGPLEHHGVASRPDLVIEAHRPAGEEFSTGDTLAEVVMIESKIGSKEGSEQLRRYAEHLDGMEGIGGKTLMYITRGYDPKDPDEILSDLNANFRFKQLRWHGFYRFLQTLEKDSLIEEVIAFMEEQGMARSYRFSAADLMALSGLPQAFDLMDETLDGGVNSELEHFTGSKSRRESMSVFRRLRRYCVLAQLHGFDLFCYVGYHLNTADGYPEVGVHLQAQPRATGRSASIDGMRRIVLFDGWDSYNLDDPAGWAGVHRTVSLAGLLSAEDHVAAVEQFFIESIRQLRVELTAFKKERPDLPWNGGSSPAK